MNQPEHQPISENAHVLDVHGLKTYFDTPEGVAKAVDDVSFSIRKGEIFCLVGESGCGKSVTALSIMGLLPKPSARIAGGEIMFEGENLLKLSNTDMQAIRGARISMIFQEPMTSLNPVFKVGKQVAEVIRLHQHASAPEAKRRTIDLFRLVRLPEPELRYHEYPHQLSGGMKQRIMIAMALACKPPLIIADEPTTALDVTIQEQILELLTELKDELGCAVMLVTHNLGIVSKYGDRVAVMYAGKIVETADTSTLLTNPKHPYTRLLLAAIPSRDQRDKALQTIDGNVPPATAYSDGCRFAERCPISEDKCTRITPPLKEAEPAHAVACLKVDESHLVVSGPAADDAPRIPVSVSLPIVEARDVKIYYPIRKGLMKRIAGYVKAVDGFTLAIEKGQTTALVGESGCGKTTFGKALVCLNPVTEGELLFDAYPIGAGTASRRKELHRRVQMIFQDPYSSLDPRMKVKDILREGPRALKLGWSEKRLQELLELVSLPSNAGERYPHEFSGGQRQRIGIARALSVDPDFIICDEATSALDVSVQAQILNLLKSIQNELGLTYLIITHDLAVVEYLADTIAVMYLGRIVEQGPTADILDNPHHPYTRALLEAVPRIDEESGDRKLVISGDVPSPINPPAGCHFHPRCPFVMEECKIRYPDAKDLGDGHYSRCWLDKKHE